MKGETIYLPARDLRVIGRDGEAFHPQEIPGRPFIDLAEELVWRNAQSALDEMDGKH